MSASVRTDSHVVPDAHRAKPHVKIGKPDPEQTHPCPKHVATIQAADTAIAWKQAGDLGKLVAEIRRPDGAANDNQTCSRPAKRR